MNQPRMLSNEEWEVVGEACGFIHKTYEEYCEWKQKRVKWESGMMAWNSVDGYMRYWEPAFSRNVMQPPTQDQLADYQNDPVEICEAARKAKGDEYFTEKGLAWLRSLDKLDAETDLPDSEGDPANTCSPSLASPANVEEFLEEHKAEKESKPSHKYKAKDTVIWDGIAYMDSGLVKKEADPCEVKIIEVLSTASVFDYEIRHNDTRWRVHASQLTPIPDKKPVRVGNVVWDSERGVFGIILRQLVNDDEAIETQLKDGSLHSTWINRLSLASPEQIDKFYTVKVDGVRYRFYEQRHVYWYTSNKQAGYYSLCEPGIQLINQHYKHLVLSVDDVEEMIPPTEKGETK